MIVGLKRILAKSRKSFIRDNSVRTQLFRLLAILAFILTMHTLAMVYLEGMAVDDAIWLTMTSATTVGYGDLSAQTATGRIATVILLYIGGIAILAQVAAMYFEHRQEIRNRMLKGNWSWIMENHIVFLNCPEEIGEEYFYQAISGLRKSCSDYANLPIIIVSDKFKDGISDRLRKLDVVNVSKLLSNQETLESASVSTANTIVILSKDQLDPTSDSINFDLIDRLREMGVKARIIAEAVKDDNRSRLKKVGANNVLRPIRTYPELLMRAIAAPGSEQVIETLFDSVGEECIRYDIEIEASWLEVIQKVTDNDFGIPISYESKEGEIINCPSSKEQVNAKALFVIVSEGNAKSQDEVRQALSA